MTEPMHVALRAIGVVLPAAGVLGLVELRGGAPDGDFGAFLGAMGLSLLAAAVWAALDAGRAWTSRVLLRWVASAFVVGVGLGITTTVTAPGSPPGPERMSEAVSLSLFYGVPLLVSAGLGVAVGAAHPQSRRRHEENCSDGYWPLDALGPSRDVPLTTGSPLMPGPPPGDRIG